MHEDFDLENGKRGFEDGNYFVYLILPVNCQKIYRGKY